MKDSEVVAVDRLHRNGAEPEPLDVPPPGDGDDTGARWRADWQLPSPSLDEFLDEPEPEFDWLIPGLLERGDRVIITAGEGVGKSTFKRQFAVQAAAGIHPFTLEEIDPITVVVLDLENPKRKVRRDLRPLRISAGDRLDAARCRVSVVPEGIDLMHERGLMALDDLLARHEPDLALIGPLYKLATGDPKDEEQAQAVRGALDGYRARYGCAFIIEAHRPYPTGGAKQRPQRPYGASLWSRWPEFGICLEGTATSPAVSVDHWRGARDERAWPKSLKRGGEWPWTVAVGKDHTLARILDVGRAHFAATGDLPSLREVAEQLELEGVAGASKSTVSRVLKANPGAWEAIAGDPE